MIKFKGVGVELFIRFIVLLRWRGGGRWCGDYWSGGWRGELWE